LLQYCYEFKASQICNYLGATWRYTFGMDCLNFLPIYSLKILGKSTIRAAKGT
jgi:hypothetical protein